MNQIEFGNEKLPSIIKDPFSKTQIIGINVFFNDYYGNGKWEASGTVKFKNGNTTGEQKFSGNTFDEVVLQIKAMIETL